MSARMENWDTIGTGFKCRRCEVQIELTSSGWRCGPRTGSLNELREHKCEHRCTQYLLKGTTLQCPGCDMRIELTSGGWRLYWNGEEHPERGSLRDMEELLVELQETSTNPYLSAAMAAMESLKAAASPLRDWWSAGF